MPSYEAGMLPPHVHACSTNAIRRASYTEHGASNVRTESQMDRASLHGREYLRVNLWRVLSRMNSKSASSRRGSTGLLTSPSFTTGNHEHARVQCTTCTACARCKYLYQIARSCDPQVAWFINLSTFYVSLRLIRKFSMYVMLRAVVAHRFCVPILKV